MCTNLLLVLLHVFFVQFTDKPENTAPALSPEAIAMRQAHGIELDSLDYPVSSAYIDTIEQKGAYVFHTSRWFNGATVEIADSTMEEQIKALSFVRSVEMTRIDTTKVSAISRRKMSQLTDTMSRADSIEAQFELYNLRKLQAAGFEGQGIRMAVCDGGFYNVNNVSWADEEHFLGYYDFTDDKDDFFGKTGGHGSHVLSFIAGNVEGNYHGAAVDAHYYLMRSEENDTESPKEMDNLVAALEKADSLGVHIFSSSLGYYQFDNSAWNLTYKQMDGQSTRVSRAATIASNKGMLVCISAGNEGNKAWHYIDCPADADHILAVGAVDIRDTIAPFSSRGPSSDGRIKPDVCAMGRAAWYVSPDGVGLSKGNGTSYACPMLSGMAAALWSALPTLSGKQIRELIIQSSDRYDNPNNIYGYGIPDAWKAYTEGQKILTAVPQTESVYQSRKVFREGHIYILNGDRLINLMGEEVR